MSKFESFIYLTNIFSDSVAYIFSFNPFWWTEILNFNIVIVSTFLLLIFFCYCCFLFKTSLPDPISCLRHLCLTQFDEDIFYYFLLDVWDSFSSSSSFFFFFNFWLHFMACRILVPRPGIEPVLLEFEATWPPGKSQLYFLKIIFILSIVKEYKWLSLLSFISVLLKQLEFIDVFVLLCNAVFP